MGKVHLTLGFAAALGALGCGSFEKGATGNCSALGACGGNPVGAWTSVVDSCQFQPVRPAQAIDVTEFTQNSTGPMTAMIAPPQPNPVVTTQTTSGDWCSSLVYNPDSSVSNVQLWHDAPILDAANITYGPDMSYLTTLTFSTKGFAVDRNTTRFPQRCLLANGAPPPVSCSAFAAGLTTFYKPQTAGVPPNFDQINCTDDGAGGCNCTYVYTVVVSDQGMWKSEGTTLLQDSSIFLYNGAMLNSQSPATTLKSTYCAQNGRLQLTGPAGGSLFGVLGLRTLELSQSQP